MDFALSCETYLRLCEIATRLASTHPDQYLKSIYLERHNNDVIAVTTCVKLAVIERIGIQEGPNEAFAIAINDQLRAQCQVEAEFGGMITIVHNDALSYTAAKTSMGYNYPGSVNVALPKNHEFKHWRKWFPDALPDQSDGCMFWTGESILALCNASPSGALIFPEYINTKIPAVIRDTENPDWFALFLPNAKGHEDLKFRDLPTWVK